MRRYVFLSLGVLEFFVALALLGFAWQLPNAAEVGETVSRVARVGRQTGRQVHALRDQLHSLRERRPQLHELAVRLQEQMRTVNEHLRGQQVDYDTVRTVSEAMGEAAEGLDGLGTTLDPDGVGRVGTGLKAAADYLDEQVAPAATQAADQLEKTSGQLKEDAERLASLLRAAPVDLKAARQVHDSLGRFRDGLDRLEGLLKLQRAETMRDGFKGLEESLNTGAGQVERLAGYTYPAVRFDGLRPVVEQRQFWPEGDKIAEGMRKAAKGATAAGEELEQLTRDLPRLREALVDSRKVVTTTREALATALGQQEKVEELLKNAPEHAARLAEELPRLATALARVLRDTARLKDVAGLLRQAQKTIDVAVSRWPELRKNLARSAVLLRATQKQLRYVVDHRSEYEASLRGTLTLSRTVSAALPLLTEQLEQDLHEQEQSLTNLGEGIDEVTGTLPGLAARASGLLQTTRFLLLLLAGVFALHGIHMVLSERAALVRRKAEKALGLDAPALGR
jgi:ABC-type transporter Mla subunit MlaD